MSPAKSQAEEPQTNDETKHTVNVTLAEKPELSHGRPDPGPKREVDNAHRLEEKDQTLRGRPSLKAGPVEASKPIQTPSKPTAEAKPQEHRSRLSSSFSDDSGVSLDPQDSPITSIDEDLNPRSEEQPAASANVSEADSVCDTPAQPAAQDIAKQEASFKDENAKEGDNVEIKHSDEEGNGSDDDDDFGDFEAPSPVDTRAQDFPLTAAKTEVKPANTHAPSMAVQQLVEKFGPIQFELNLQAIDQLFPNAPDHTQLEGRRHSNVSEQIITDSFSTVSERKTWYRISRYGSMRKHDSGEDENYHGVTWKSSQLHDDVIKIVRRWMEEDSFAGKPNLGGAKRENVFNWDSDSPAAPISLKDVFARRKSITHVRTTSLPPSPQNAPAFGSSFSNTPGNRRTFGGSIEVPNGATASIRSPLAHAPLASAPIATFDWSSSIAASPSRASVSSSSSDQGAVRPQPTPKSLVPDSFPVVPSTKPTSKNALHISLPPKEAEQFNDDDDDWGEMVSSPAPGPSQATVGKSAVTKISTEVARMHNRSISQPQSAFKWPEILTPRSPSKPDSGARSPKKINTRKTSTTTNGHRYTKSLSKPPATRSTISSVDPWASADFSIFDQPITTPVLSPVSAKSPVAFEPVRVASMDSPRSSSPTYQQAPLPPVTRTKVVLGPIETTVKAREQDEFVQRILQNLPDLSYMLH